MTPDLPARRHAIAAAARLAVALALVACATDRLARDLDTWTGSMTREVAERRLGRPTRTMTIAGQEVWSYEEQTVVGALPAPASPKAAPGPFVGRTVRRQILLYFDAEGVLTHWHRF